VGVAAIGFGLGRLDHLVAMLRRSVDRVEAERLGPRVANVVASACGNDHGEIVHHWIFATVDVDRALPFFDPEELVAVLVDFLPNLFTRLEGHQHELQMLPRINDVPEVLVVDRQPLDIVAKTPLHEMPSPFAGYSFSTHNRRRTILFSHLSPSTDRCPSS